MFGNCQSHSIDLYLKSFSNFYNYYETFWYANWQLLKSCECIPLHLIESVDLVIYQQFSDIHNCYSTNKNNLDSFFNLLQDNCNTISFSRIHNNSISIIFFKVCF